MSEGKEAKQEISAAGEKSAAFKKYLDENKITGFLFQDMGNDVHAGLFRSNLPIQGQNLPFMIALDDSVYTIIQVQVASGIVQKEKKADICSFLNDLNEQYRMLKYSADGAGNILLTCCIPAGNAHFEPALEIAILNQIQGHLNAVYPQIMEKLWKK